MRFTIDKDGYVDFEAPICVTDKQRDKIIEFMKELFPAGVKTKKVTEPVKDITATPSERKPWTAKDYFELLNQQNSNKDIGVKLGRSEMGICMKRSEFVSEFSMWRKEKGFAGVPTLELVIKFIKEKGWI